MGFGEDDISLLMSDEAHLRYFPAPELKGEVVGERMIEGPGLGGVIGAGTGTMLGSLLGMGLSEEHAKKYEKRITEALYNGARSGL
jgi:hypothetical protein